ncbi:lysis system i-spanin subunit Rz, partial [Salmonella enterica subsp. enterica serovar Heidelberg]
NQESRLPPGSDFRRWVWITIAPFVTADAELNYYRLRSGIDKITAQVNYLQDYIRTQCLK